MMGTKVNIFKEKLFEKSLTFVDLEKKFVSIYCLTFVDQSKRYIFLSMDTNFSP